MAKLKLGAIMDEKPVKMTIELPGSVHRDLVAYAEVLRRATGRATEPTRLVPHMISGFIGSDREFMKQRRQHKTGEFDDASGRPTGTVNAAPHSAGRQSDPASQRFGTVDEQRDTARSGPGVSDNCN